MGDATNPCAQVVEAEAAISSAANKAFDAGFTPQEVARVVELAWGRRTDDAMRRLWQARS